MRDAGDRSALFVDNGRGAIATIGKSITQAFLGILLNAPSSESDLIGYVSLHAIN